MKALVTGGAGFIGSTLVDRLLAEGHAVDVIDDLSTGSLQHLAGARRDPSNDLHIDRLDITSPEVTELIARRRPEVIFHLAARPASAATADPVADASASVVGSLRVLEGARRGGTHKVVFATSGTAIYGRLDPAHLPARESGPRGPGSLHGVGKDAVARYLAAYRDRFDLEYTALALGSVYGPRQDAAGSSGVVAALVTRLVTGHPGIIHGDGRQTRDFVYVDDVVDALARAATRGSGLILNVGTGIETSIRTLYQVVAATFGAVPAPEPGPGRPEEIGRFSLDPGRAAIHLGWRPWTGLEAGVAAVVDWSRSASR